MARERSSSRRRSAWPAPGSPSSPRSWPTRSASRCGRSAPTRASRRCSTSAATRVGAGPRRRSARTRTSSRACGVRSSAASRAQSLAERRGRDAEALRRLRRVGRRDELGAGRHPAARAARGVPAPVRGGRSHRRRSLGDERLQRDRRHALRRRSRAPHADAAGASGGSTASSCPTTSRSGSSPSTTGWPWTGRAPRRMALEAGLDVELPATDCYGAPLLARARGGARRRGRRSTRRCGGCCARSSSSASSSGRTSTRAGRVRRRSDGGPPRARADDRPQEHRAAEQRRGPAAGRRASGRWP